jgi:hypothetical protein
MLKDEAGQLTHRVARRERLLLRGDLEALARVRNRRGTREVESHARERAVTEVGRK